MNGDDFPTPVVVITYGHAPEMVCEALSSALELQAEQRTRPIILDDHSGKAPRVDGAETLETPANVGYAGAVNFAIQRLAPPAGRIVFINPDAQVPVDTLRELIELGEDCSVAVPRIRAGKSLENVRRTLRPSQVLRQLVASRFGSQDLLEAEDQLTEVVMPEWAAAGTVASFSVEFVRRFPLSEEMFWVEMSAWARTVPAGTKIRVTGGEAFHLGASSKANAAVAVNVSLVAARLAYVRRFGSRVERSFLPAVFALHLAFRLILGKITFSGVRGLVRVYRGDLEWQQIKTL